MAGVDQPDWTTTTNISAGTVTIGGTPTVQLAAGAKVVITGNVEIIATAPLTVTGQLASTTVPLQAVANQIVPTTFGTGATGTVTLSANTTLTKTPAYKNLTINAGVVLKPAGHIIFVQKAFSHAGVVTASGAAGISGSATNHTFTGGAGSPGSVMPGGANGGKVVTKTSTTTPTATPGGNAPTASYQGGAGGAGQATGSSSKLSTGGTAKRTATIPPTFTLLRTRTVGGGAGGGSGGRQNHAATGGGAGGPIVVVAKSITGAGTFTANGGAGAGATHCASGGGGAGVVFVYSHAATTWTGSATAVPGAAGTSTTSGHHPATPGSTGWRRVQLKFVGRIPV